MPLLLDLFFTFFRIGAFTFGGGYAMLPILERELVDKRHWTTMDDLRDYRFYADDMIHPSAKAVDYIWQRFQDTYFDNKTKDVVAKAEKAWRQHQHRVLIKN